MESRKGIEFMTGMFMLVIVATNDGSENTTDTEGTCDELGAWMNG